METIERYGIGVRWVTGPHQLARPLAKNLEKASGCLINVLRTNHDSVVRDPMFTVGKELSREQHSSEDTRAKARDNTSLQT